MFKKVLSTVAGATLISLTVACTPEQIASLKEHGIVMTEAQEAEWLELPDVDRTLGNKTFHTDGRVSISAVPPGSKCPQHYEEALDAGWSHDQWSRIDYVMYRESRCNPNVHNPVGRDDSYGLMQLNMKAHRSWVGPIVGWDFTRLYDPTTNLRIAKVLYDKAVDYYGCGWKPWTTRNTKWC